MTLQEERRKLSPGTITWRLIATVMGSLILLGGTAWISKTDTRIENLEKAQFEMGREISEIKMAVKSLLSTTETRLSQVEATLSIIGREVSGLSVAVRASENMQNQIVLSVREMRDDMKILVREKGK